LAPSAPTTSDPSEPATIRRAKKPAPSRAGTASPSPERIIPGEVATAKKHFETLRDGLPEVRKKHGDEAAWEALADRAKAYLEKRTSRAKTPLHRRRVEKSIRFAHRQVFPGSRLEGDAWGEGAEKKHLGAGEKLAGAVGAPGLVKSAFFSLGKIPLKTYGLVKEAISGFSTRLSLNETFGGLVEGTKELYGVAKGFAQDPNGQGVPDLLDAVENTRSAVDTAGKGFSVISSVIGGAFTIIGALLTLPDKIITVINRINRAYAAWAAGRKKKGAQPWREHARYGTKKLLRSVLANLGKLLKSLADAIMALGGIVTTFLFPPASLIISGVRLVGDIAALTAEIGSKVKGMIKYFKGTRGKARFAAADAFVKAAISGDEDAAKLIKKLNPYGTMTEKLMDHVLFWKKKQRRKLRDLLKGTPAEVGWGLRVLSPKDRKALTEELADRLKST
jgi:hypothetical protein